MNKKITAIIIAACVAIITFFLGGAFLIYNSFIKTQELQAKVKIEQEKTKQEMLKTQNDQQMVQVTTSQETSVPVVAKKGQIMRLSWWIEWVQFQKIIW